MSIHSVISSTATSSEVPVGREPLESGIDRAVSLLRNLPIWADPANEVRLREVSLPREIQTVRLHDAADGSLIGSLTRTNNRPLTAYEVADVLSWHIDYRDSVWVSTRVRSIQAESLDLWIEFAAITR